MTIGNNINDSHNPWNGLRTYSEGEIIYGRSEEIQILSLLILQNNQTVVYGRSGIGKSSILNAGIFPIARKQGVFPVYIRFEHNVETSYLQQIKDAILRETKKHENEIYINKLVEKSGEESLWEFFHRIEYRNKEGLQIKPLIVFDQFEEIFTLESNKNKVSKFFLQLADLINNVMPEDLSENVSMPKKQIEDNTGDSGTLDLGLEAFSSVSYSYKTNSDYHLVFTLREDFLSYLERNTTDIPSLKNNRYCLQPINDEQAAEIIMEPRPGLVDKSVAELIIEKVTGEKDFEINGIPEIHVDSAILSLYLSRLYDKMSALGESKITAELVETYGDNIIEDFYSEAIKDLPTESVQWLENTLVNDDGRRDNRDWSTILKESGLSAVQIKDLIYEKKLLRQFSYSGGLRIELIHDVLCQVIEKHRQEREEKRHLDEVRKKAKKDRRILLIKTISIAAAIIGAVIMLSVWWLRHNSNYKIIEQKQNLVLSLEEDSTVKDMDFWKADLRVSGKYESGRDSLLLVKSINKSDISEPITISTDSCVSINFTLDFGDFADIGKYENISIELPIEKIMESPYVKLPVSRDLPDLHLYSGRIVLDVENADIPLENAIVMMGDIVAVTDSMGNFNLAIEETPDEQTSILIAKGSLGCFEIPAMSQSDESNIYRILPLDSLHSFLSRAEEMDTISRWSYSTVGRVFCANQGSQNGLYIKFSDGHEDRLKMYWKKGESQGDRVLLSGYFFFKGEKEELDKTGSGKYAYYIGTGYIDRKIKKDENNASYRNFEFKGYDAASNLRTITGKYYSIRGAGKYTGDITSNKRQIATFGHVVTD